MKIAEFLNPRFHLFYFSHLDTLKSENLERVGVSQFVVSKNLFNLLCEDESTSTEKNIENFLVDKV